MIRLKCLPVALVLVVCRLVPASAHDGPHDSSAPHVRAGREMAEAARNLWAALSPEQRGKLAVDFADPLRHDWHFIPRTRKGLPLKEMTSEQRALATALLASGMSQAGFIRSETIISLEKVLLDLEQGRGPVRDPEGYFFNIFGNPDAFGAGGPWGWRVEGHHLSLNFTIVGDHGIAGSPIFMGSNPAEVRTGPRKGLRVLGQEEDLARRLVASLDDVQKKKAIISAEAPKDILTMAVRQAQPIQPAGIMVPDLNAEQKKLLNELIVLYAERLRPEIAGNDLGRIMKAGIDHVGFAWAGPIERGQPHYYRVQGPTFLIEYDNTQGNANHVHSVWRDFGGDFGTDLLKQHYESAGPDHGHDHAPSPTPPAAPSPPK